MTSPSYYFFDCHKIGNRDAMTVNGATTDYTYNVLDQLVGTSSPTGTVAYTYDGRGNLDQITAGSQTTDYTYNAADRLANVTLPDTTIITYGYDADGRRIKQTVDAQVTNYLWDEASVYGDVVLETDGSGATLASYVLDERGIVSQTRSGETNYYLPDGQGSTRALTNAAGSVTDTYSYTAFGELLDQTGSTANSYLYTGQQFDSLTGLYDLRARYYDPALGRFLSQDTYPVNFGNPVELNRYVYTANNPINGMDPTGHMLVGYAPLTSASARRTAAASYTIGRSTSAMYMLLALMLFPAAFLLVQQFKELPTIDAGELDTETLLHWLKGGKPPSGKNDIDWVILALVCAAGGMALSSYYSGSEQSTSESQKPIVLDLGPSDNFVGEIIPLITHYNGQAKVVGVDDELDLTMMKKSASDNGVSALMLQAFEYIESDYARIEYIKTTLASRGYNECAIATYSLWPDPPAESALVMAVNNLTCPGGQIFIAGENFKLIERLASRIGGEPKKTTAQCLENPACSPVGFPLSSRAAYVTGDVYYLLTYKQ